MSDRIAERTIAEIERHLRRHEKKEKTSVSLSGELIAAADALAGKSQRSALIERALRSYLKRMLRRYNNDRDLAAINAHAAVTNREAEKVLELQAWPE